jgi:23S rRNA (guanosine2251-2'-O)-methyltransferase
MSRGSATREKRILIPGFHAVRETLLREETKIEAVWVAKGRGRERVREILEMAHGKGIPVLFKEGHDLDRHLPGVSHQGIAALMGGFAYSGLTELVDRHSQHSEQGLLVAADHITDEGNLGALIRTAAFFGIHGLILPRDRSAKVTGKVIKRSSGACAHLPIAQVVNLGRSLDRLREEGFWIIGTAGEARVSIYEFDWNRDLVLVLGSEEKGLSRSIRERCHQTVRIPGSGHVSALNVSVAGGIILAEILRQRQAAGSSLGRRF